MYIERSSGGHCSHRLVPLRVTSPFLSLYLIRSHPAGGNIAQKMVRVSFVLIPVLCTPYLSMPEKLANLEWCDVAK